MKIPEFSLVVLIGCSGSGKSTFARRQFKPTEILSSDFCRGLVSDDENDQSCSDAAFDVLHYVAAKRLASGRLTVVDATNVEPEWRRPLVEIARKYHALPVAVVLDVDPDVCNARNDVRTDRSVRPAVVARQRAHLRRGISRLQREGFRTVHVLRSPQEVDAAVIEREPLWCNRKTERGPFDIIGDVHGCCDELEQLLEMLGYVTGERADDVWDGPVYRHPEGRRAIFLGDIVDRGPRIVDALRVVRNMVAAGSALCVPGNHDVKLLRKLRGKDVRITHGLDRTLAEMDALGPDVGDRFRAEAAAFIDSLVSHCVLDGGGLVVAHAGMRADLQGRGSGTVREFALYGETTGETDEYGLPVRHNWAAEYRGRPMVVYGHTPTPMPDWVNNTICIDTGCVFGGALTALRYPERELVSVPAASVYCAPTKPLTPEADGQSAQQAADDVLDLEDVIGRRRVNTRLLPSVTVREENAAAALEVMSRHAANPRWLIYLPPTMSPPETSSRRELLEHPDEAFTYFRNQGVPHVLCEEKHMGSRAVVIACADESVARRRFGVAGEGIGIIYTRTGRRFFDEQITEAAVLARVRDAMSRAGLFDDLQTDWVCLDCELLPWSAKAQSLLRQQYAPVGAAADLSLSLAVQALERAAARCSDASALLEHSSERLRMARAYRAAWSGYCWTVNDLDDLKLAPFHVLAGEQAVYADRDHEWHVSLARRLHEADERTFRSTRSLRVDVTHSASVARGIEWWDEMTRTGGEGMVVKPLSFLARGPRGLVQPGIKCRGPEYLRIIYGPEYSAPENLERLRPRRVFAKRSLALREFALGIEGLERFVRREPLRRVHECVFAVLALESEPVDPRL